MCDFSEGFKLCSCDGEKIRFRKKAQYSIENGKPFKPRSKKEADIPVQFIWRLFRLKSPNTDSVLGLYKLPAEDIGHGLNAEWIVLNLNEKNCFDFDYTPEEGDNLFIQTNETGSPYISFVFTKNQWTIEHYDPFNWNTEHIRDGLIK